MIPQKQLSLADIFENCKNIFDDDRPKFLDLLEEHIDLESLIPSSFWNHYHSYVGRNAHEIKAKEAYPCVKYHILECIAKKSLSISYIIIDLKHIEQRLLFDKNILYNYAAKILIGKLITKKDEGTTINILFDNKTTKIASKNSLRDYIIAYLVYEKRLDVTIHFEYKDSDAGDAFIIQAADYVANALYNQYEYDNTIYSNILKPKIFKREHFPYKNFGK